MAKSLETAKQEVRSLLITYPKGVCLEEFIRTYKNLLATRLPSREFGFTTPIDFLHSIPDVVHIEMDKNGTYQLRALANKDTEHIQKLVQKQKTVKGKTDNKSNSSTRYNRQNGFVKTSSSITKCRPFVPAVIRAEIIEVVKQYPEGIGYTAFIMAYQRIFNRAPNFCFLSDKLPERFQQLSNAVPELEVKMVNRQEKLHYVPQNSPRVTPTIEETLGKFARLQPLIVKDKATSPFNGVKDVSAIPSHMKYNIEKILKKHPEGILAIHFPILYEDFSKTRFDLHDLGYNHLLDLVDALPDIFTRVESTENPNDWKLFHVDFSDNIADARKLPVAMNGALYQKPSRLSHSLMNTKIEMSPPALQYCELELPGDSRDTFFPVFISAFIDPHLFWFQMDAKETNERFQKLQKDIEYFYNTQMYGKYKMKDADILIGSSCVAFFSEDNQWYRCVITALLNTEDVKVLFVDYGSWETIPRSHLYYLKYSFMFFPKQAFQARLAFVQPANMEGTWETNAKYRFLELCNKRFIMAKVCIMQNHVATVLLCDVSGDEEVYINDALINESLAECSAADESGLPSLNGSALSNNPSPDVVKIPSNKESGTETSSSMQNSLTNGYSTPELKKINAINKVKALQISKNRKAVRRILLSDGYCIHILIVEEKAFVSGEDLCDLLWKGKGADVLACRLDFKEVQIPTLSISKEKYVNLFTQCERYKVGGFNQTAENYSVILYPLKYSIKVLNVFGHHSVNIRQRLLQEIQEFNPHASMWSQSEANGESYDNLPCDSENDLDKLCIYDLTIIREALECKRLKFLISYKNKTDENLLKKLKDIESRKSCISQKIKEIEKICLKYKYAVLEDIS